jgi:hypothetical protein
MRPDVRNPVTPAKNVNQCTLQRILAKSVVFCNFTEYRWFCVFSAQIWWFFGINSIQNDTKELLLVGGGHHLLTVVVRAAVRIVVLFAAVLTYSGEHEHPSTTSFRALLRHAKVQIEGPLLLTLAFGYVLGIAKFVLLAVMASLVGILMATQYHVALSVAALLLVAVYVGGEYFSFLCSFSVVVAVAEPRCHGAAKLGRSRGRKA